MQLLVYTGEETCPVVGKRPVCLLRERLHRLAPPSMVAYLASSAAVPESKSLEQKNKELLSQLLLVYRRRDLNSYAVARNRF